MTQELKERKDAFEWNLMVWNDNNVNYTTKEMMKIFNFINGLNEEEFDILNQIITLSTEVA